MGRAGVTTVDIVANSSTSGSLPPSLYPAIMDGPIVNKIH